MVGNTVRLGRLWGIEVRLHYSWFIVFVLVTWSLAVFYFPQVHRGWTGATYWGMGIVTSLLFFVSVLIHELAHSFVARAEGLPVRGITLFIFGGASQISEEPRRPGDEFRMAVVGPLASLLLGVLFGVLWWLSRGGATPFHLVTGYLAFTNIALGVFNLIPGFPLDGGRVLRSIIWQATHDMRRATRIASIIGRVVAFAFIFWGIWEIFAGFWANGLWIAFIGWFLDNAAVQSYQQLAVRQALTGHTAREVMTSYPTIPPGVTLQTFVDQFMLPSGRRCFPVVDNGRFLGLLTLDRIKGVPRDRWPFIRVQDVMIPIGDVKTVGPDEDLSVVFQRMVAEDVNQLPIVDNGRFLGVVARDNLMQFLHLREDLAA